MAETITTTGTGGLYSNYCYNRLPCGVCRILMCQCPVQNGCGVTPVPTWNPNEVIYKADEGTDFSTKGHLHLGYAEGESE